jgi:hypothetical protein
MTSSDAWLIAGTYYESCNANIFDVAAVRRAAIALDHTKHRKRVLVKGFCHRGSGKPRQDRWRRVAVFPVVIIQASNQSRVPPSATLRRPGTMKAVAVLQPISITVPERFPAAFS